MRRRVGTVERWGVEGHDRDGVLRVPERARNDSGDREAGLLDASVLTGAMPPPLARRPSVRVLSRKLGMDVGPGLFFRRFFRRNAMIF